MMGQESAANVKWLMQEVTKPKVKSDERADSRTVIGRKNPVFII